MNKAKSANRLFFAMFLFSNIGSVLIGNFAKGLTTEMLLIISQLLFLIPCIIYLAVGRVPVKREIPFCKIKATTILMIILFTVLIYPLMSFLNLISMLFSSNHIGDVTTGLTSNGFLPNLLLLAIIPAISEEFMFRGIFYGAYRKRSCLFGAVAGGLVFGMAHMNLNQFCYAFVLGFIMCVLVEVTGSIFSSIIVHFLVNGWSVVVLAVQKFMAENESLFGQLVSQTQSTAESLTKNDIVDALGAVAVVALVSTALAACVLVWIGKNCGREEHLKEIFTKPAVKAIPDSRDRIITPFFVVNIILCFTFMIMLG